MAGIVAACPGTAAARRKAFVTGADLYRLGAGAGHHALLVRRVVLDIRGQTPAFLPPTLGRSCRNLSPNRSGGRPSNPARAGLVGIADKTGPLAACGADRDGHTDSFCCAPLAFLDSLHAAGIGSSMLVDVSFSNHCLTLHSVCTQLTIPAASH